MIRSTLIALLALSSVQAQKPAWQERMERAAQSPQAWNARREDVRRQILVAAGLWPEFERPALQPAVSGRIEREGYTVEKVRLETLPGLHLTGNLYRPLGKSGPFPAVVSPHGHWKNGRFEDTQDASIPGRSLTLARLGFVVFTYDMVGYGDFKQLPHQFSDPEWGVGLLGLQLWNSLRAVDFVASLPDVDPKRIGATGASGGGTQTFLLAAVDDRIQCAVPVNMVAAEFQGGCSCENAPFLRLGLNNVEIAAATAPRALMLVSCTGDWTKLNPTLEAPAIQKAFASLKVPEKFRVAQFNYGHNYNKDSREAVYAWMVRWLQGGPEQEKIAEPPFTVEKREDLSVYAGDQKLPEGAVDAAGLQKVFRARIAEQLEKMRPRNAASLKAWRDAMAVSFQKMFAAWTPVARVPGGTARTVTLFVAAREEDAAPFASNDDVVLVLKPHDRETPAGGNDAQRKSYVTTFYRTALSWQVQDVVGELAKLSARADAGAIRLVGIGEAGLPALLARSVASGSARIALTIIDVSKMDAALQARPHPGMNRIGGWKAAALTAEPGVLVLHGGAVDAGIRDAYKAAGRDGALILSETSWTAEQVRAAVSAP